jgi:hypothetical protein
MRWFNKTAATAAFAAGLLAAGYADAQEFTATANGFAEVPAILSSGTGTLALSLDQEGQALNYQLSYSGFPSGDTVSSATINFGKPGVAGGVLAYLCENTPTVTPAPPSCLSVPVSATLGPSSIQGISAQGVSAGNFGALAAALLSGTAYVNIETSAFAAGEIRGQIHPCRGHGDGQDWGGDHCGQGWH